MESLVFTAVVVVLAVTAAGAASAVTALRPPRHPVVRAMSRLVAVSALILGIWLATLPVGAGAAAVGATAAVAGAASLTRPYRSDDR